MTVRELWVRLVRELQADWPLLLRMAVGFLVLGTVLGILRLAMSHWAPVLNQLAAVVIVLIALAYALRRLGS